MSRNKVQIDREELELLYKKSIMLDNMSAWFVSYVFDKYQYQIKEVSHFFIYWFFIKKLENATTISSDEHFDNLKTNIFAFNVANENDNEHLESLIKTIQKEINYTINAKSREVNKKHKV